MANAAATDADVPSAGRKTKAYAMRLLAMSSKAYCRMTACACHCRWDNVIEGWRKKAIDAGTSIMIWKRNGS